MHGPGNLFARRVNTPPGESVGGWTPDTDDETPRLVRLCGTRSGHLDPLRACSRQSGVGRRVVRGGQRCRLGHPVLEHQIWLPCLISCVGPWLCRGGTIRPRICGASSILTAVIHPRDRAGHRDPRDSGGFVAGTDETLDVFDVQHAMLDDVMARARAQGVTNIRAKQGDAQELPYRDGTFDGAYLVGVLGEIPDEHTALRELRRVLKPNGRLVIGEVFFDPDFVRFSSLKARGGTGLLRVRAEAWRIFLVPGAIPAPPRRSGGASDASAGGLESRHLVRRARAARRVSVRRSVGPAPHGPSATTGSHSGRDRS